MIGHGRDNLQQSLPWVSVIITTHNYGRYLTAAFASITAQTYDRVECIIVDDGSTDDTAEVLARIASLAERFKVKILRNETAQGQYSAMRRGFGASTGQFVVFLDADDLLAEEFVASHVACHLSDKVHVALSTSDQWLIDGDGLLIGVNPRSKFGPYLSLSPGLIRSVEWDDTLLKRSLAVEEIAADANDAAYWIWGTTSSMMFRRDILSLIMTRELDLRICADEYLANFAHAIGGTAVVKGVLGMYRRHQTNNFANNLVLGGFVPLARRSRSAAANPRRQIVTQLQHEAKNFNDVLGDRQFANLVMRFCSTRQGVALLRAHRVGFDHIFGQLLRKLVRGMRAAARAVRREVSWVAFRRPTYW